MKDKKDKKKPKSAKARKPVNNLDFDALEPAIVDGKLVVVDKLLVLNRTWRTTTDERISLCTVMWIKDDTVMLEDETFGQVFSFDLNKDVGIHQLLRVYDKTKVRKPSKESPNLDVIVSQESSDGVPMDEEGEEGTSGDDEAGDAD